MPHTLYRKLLSRPSGDRRRIALVKHRGEPVMLAGLRRHSRFVWEPVGNWHAPGPVFPFRPQHMYRALRSISLEMPLAWWRTGMALPDGPAVQSVETSPTYRMKLDCDPEGYWRKTGYLPTVKRMRNRCNSFTVKTNHPGTAAWVIRNWRQRWSPIEHTDNDSRADLSDRIMVAEELEKIGRHVTISLFDGDRLVGGTTTFVHQGELVAGVMHCEPEYRAQGPGVRLIELSFQFGIGQGLQAIDIGGKADYKKKWAPEDGTRSRVVVAPLSVQYLRKVASTVRALAGRAYVWLLLASIQAVDCDAIGVVVSNVSSGRLL